MRWVTMLVLGLLVAVEAFGATRVASINLRNYLVQDRRVGERWLREHPKPEAEKEAIRRAIAEIDPDILALQEMGPRPFLLELQRDLKADGLDYPYAVLLEADDPDRHLAVLSRVEPVEVVPHTDMDFPYEEERLPIKRGLLEVVFPTGEDGQTWSLFVVHLKSRWSDVDTDPLSSERRTKEAQAARDRILERFPEAAGLFLVAGDFNDHRSSAALRRFLQKGDLEISQMVEAYDSRRETWTFFYEKHHVYERVDFILASPEMMPRVVGQEGTVFDPLYIREGTDHRPVFVDLNLSGD